MTIVTAAIKLNNWVKQSVVAVFILFEFAGHLDIIFFYPTFTELREQPKTELF